MSEFFNELIKGLNEAIAIERGILFSHITVSDSIIQGVITEGRSKVIRKVPEAKFVTPK